MKSADLPAMVRTGKFKDDLLDRLSFEVLYLPPLRARKEDILYLARHFAAQMAFELGRDEPPHFSASAERRIEAYRWPGNIRELKNVVERSVSRWSEPNAPVGEVVIDPFESPFDDWGEPPAPAAPETAPAARPATPVRFARAVTDFEKRLLREALDAHDNHQGKTAKALGLSYDQLRGLLRKHRLVRSRRKSAAA